ncbi:MAG: phosphopantetheine-binding protein [Pseudomonadota bacterium]
MAITREAVLRIIAEESGQDVAKLVPGTKLQDLDISSIDLVSAIFTIEDKLDVTIAPEDVSPDATIDDLVDMVMARSQA